MRAVAPEPLTAEAFAPFGTVAACPRQGAVIVGPPENLRPAVPPRLRWVTAAPVSLPLPVTTMERHAYSAQSFIPAGGGDWLVLVAPHAAAGGPDMTRVRAFVAGPEQAVTYRPDTWHHPLRALDLTGRFAVLTFLDDGPDDEEFVPVDPFLVGVAS
jgi:ureidoglycolate lyase